MMVCEAETFTGVPRKPDTRVSRKRRENNASGFIKYVVKSFYLCSKHYEQT
jgi:hypothetical protein